MVFPLTETMVGNVDGEFRYSTKSAARPPRPVVEVALGTEVCRCSCWSEGGCGRLAALRSYRHYLGRPVHAGHLDHRQRRPDRYRQRRRAHHNRRPECAPLPPECSRAHPEIISATRKAGRSIVLDPIERSQPSTDSTGHAPDVVERSPALALLVPQYRRRVRLYCATTRHEAR